MILIWSQQNAFSNLLHCWMKRFPFSLCLRSRREKRNPPTHQGNSFLTTLGFPSRAIAIALSTVSYDFFKFVIFNCPLSVIQSSHDFPFWCLFAKALAVPLASVLFPFRLPTWSCVCKIAWKWPLRNGLFNFGALRNFAELSIALLSPASVAFSSRRTIFIQPFTSWHQTCEVYLSLVFGTKYCEKT